MGFQQGNQYGKHTKRGKDILTTQIKDKLKENIVELLNDLDTKSYTETQKLKYLQVILPYIIPKQKQLAHDIKEDVPLFLDEPPTFLCFTSAEQKQAYDNASEEEKEEMEKELIC